MKKVWVAAFIIIAAAFVAIYFLFPARVKISVVRVASCIPKNITACFVNQNHWLEWLTKNAITDYQYQVTQAFTDGAEVQASSGKEKIKSRLFVIPLGKDSSTLDWQAYVPTSFNPIKRIAGWFEAKQLQQDIRRAMDSLVSYAEKTENIYGFHIERTTFTDTILLATKFSTTAYPATQVIYNAIDQLRKKIKEDGAEEKDFPMLNVREIDTNQFETMIAICINKPVPDEGDFFVSMMVPMKDRFLKTEAVGGPQTVINAHQAIQNYMNDRILSAPAIPFEILVTDRSKETDTSKWKTTIFHPSM